MAPLAGRDNGGANRELVDVAGRLVRDVTLGAADISGRFRIGEERVKVVLEGFLGPVVALVALGAIGVWKRRIQASRLLGGAEDKFNRVPGGFDERGSPVGRVGTTVTVDASGSLCAG